MELFVVYGSKSSPSAKKLASSLSEHVDVRRGTTKSKLLRSKPFDFILNVGNSGDFSYLGNPIIINHPEAIQVSANKKLARIRLKAKGLPAPELWLKATDIPKCGFPVVGRTTYHMKAQGFWFCKNEKEAKSAEKSGATHFMKFIDNTREFRAHVFSTSLNPSSSEDYIIAKLSEKHQSINAEGTVIKNHDHGYKFMVPTKENPAVLSMIRAASKEVIYKFNLHYGAVDMMYSKNTNKVYTLEINTTPCLTDENSNTLEIYTHKIINLVNANL